ncbi:MAG: FtsW/RodA/SpoVE family cell cycle protein [Oligosphaeraceae bacterium]
MADGNSSLKGETPAPQPWSAEEPGSGLAFPSHLAGPCAMVLMALLLGTGVCMIASATSQMPGARFFLVQILWLVLGTTACLAGCFLNLDRLYRWSPWLLLAAVLVLAYLSLAAICVRLGSPRMLAFFPGASSVKGAVRWLRLGPVQIQPSEFAKVAMVLFLSAYYGCLGREKIKKFAPGVAVPLCCAGSILVFIFLGKDLSTTVVAGATLLGLMFLSGIRLRWVLALLLAGAAAGVFGIAGSPMRRERIVAWLHPEAAESIQLFRSQICLGIGGFSGTGYSQGYMKTYLPEPHTDFIVAVIGEEMGFLGLLGVLLGYLLLCVCILAVGKQCRRREDLLLCTGVALLIAVQSLVNVGVVSGWIPPTGVTAPFLSYGGSSVISLMFLMGLVFNVARRNAAAMWREVGNQRCLPVSLEEKNPLETRNARR